MFLRIFFWWPGEWEDSLVKIAFSDQHHTWKKTYWSSSTPFLQRSFDDRLFRLLGGWKKGKILSFCVRGSSMYSQFRTRRLEPCLLGSLPFFIHLFSCLFSPPVSSISGRVNPFWRDKMNRGSSRNREKRGHGKNFEMIFIYSDNKITFSVLFCLLLFLTWCTVTSFKDLWEFIYNNTLSSSLVSAREK